MRVGLFIPCYVDAFFPAVGIAALQLLERLGLEVVYPLDQTCCGQMMANSGSQKDAAGAEALFVENFKDFDHIVTPSGSCAYHVRDHLDAIPQTPEAQKVRRNTYELVEFLHDVLKVEAFPWAEFPHKIVLHAPKGLRRAGRSRHPLHPYRADPQWRSRMKRIDHAEAASEFIAAKAHQEFHDRRLWDLRLKRDSEAHGIPEWEELRTLASQIKEHTLTHLAEYLEEFEARAKENGAHVHWARETTENNQIVYEILSTRGAKTLVKSKSMLTEECDMRPFLERREIEVIETDLGERIQQLDDEPPSHIVVPAVHKLRGDVSAVFARTIGAEPGNDDVHYLAETQRRTTRPYFLRAEAGMTGANFAVAETGSFVVCTNEGNADLSANVPKLHIASIGIEKIIPRTEHLGVFIRLLSRSALGSPITQYTSHFRAPRDGGELHIVLVDNGRSERLGMRDFWYSLKCIRCGACMNTCPVYRRSGGLS